MAHPKTCIYSAPWLVSLRKALRAVAVVPCPLAKWHIAAKYVVVPVEQILENLISRVRGPFLVCHSAPRINSTMEHSVASGARLPPNVSSHWSLGPLRFRKNRGFLGSDSGGLSRNEVEVCAVSVDSTVTRGNSCDDPISIPRPVVEKAE